MEQREKILFWFRDNLLLKSISGICTSVKAGTEIIPVFCFDSREYALLGSRNFNSAFFEDQFRSARLLRQDLKSRGSNLLVVSHPYEKIIPSLARVLRVTRVVTNQLIQPEKTSFPDLTAFRNLKAGEVSQMLRMHSIPFTFDANRNFMQQLPDLFPRFPEINPGSIPSAGELGFSLANS